LSLNNIIFSAKSVGDLLDKEFNRLVFIEKLTLDEAENEIKKNHDYALYLNENNKKPFSIKNSSGSV
jgi:type II restriction/modification system DNA methylase subunit YeeA